MNFMDLFSLHVLTFLAPFLTPCQHAFKPFFLNQVFQILCQHISVLHQTVELIQVYFSSKSLQMAFEPAGNDSVGTILVWVRLYDRHNPIHCLLQRFPAVASVLDTKNPTQRCLAHRTG